MTTKHLKKRARMPIQLNDEIAKLPAFHTQPPPTAATAFVALGGHAQW